MVSSPDVNIRGGIKPGMFANLIGPGGGDKIDPSLEISNEYHEKLRKCLESILTNRLQLLNAYFGDA